MKALLFMSVLVFSGASFSQEGPKIETVTNHTVGVWINIHKERKDILGIKVQQFPDNSYSAAEYQGKHPAMVIYVFKSLDAHQMEYNPSGTIKNGFWWKVKKGHPILKQLINL